ncbi:hypothetical protein HanRHA438_Chr13g0593781 [Helianthus annuus]|nr:hypothetical protein HanRHA438_Chr13g0593781 [Helianthus annuus]
MHLKLKFIHIVMGIDLDSYSTRYKINNTEYKQHIATSMILTIKICIPSSRISPRFAAGFWSCRLVHYDTSMILSPSIAIDMCFISIENHINEYMYQYRCCSVGIGSVCYGTGMVLALDLTYNTKKIYFIVNKTLCLANFILPR